MLKESLQQRDEEMQCQDEVQRQRDEAMRQRETSTLRPSLISKLSFKLVDLTISFAIEHLANKLLIHYIATCIASDATARNSCAIV
jgi:hypothetical protein